MSTVMRPSPLATVLARTGQMDPNTAALGNTSAAINDLFGQVGEVLKAKMGAEALSTLITPKQTDPAETLKSTVAAVSGLAGLRSEEEKREERDRRLEQERELKEQALAVEREKLEMQRVQHSEGLQMQMMRMMMESSNKTAEAMANILKSMDDRITRREEKQDSQMQQLMAKIAEKPAASPLEEHLRTVGWEALTSRPPSLADQLKEAKETLALVTPMAPSVNANGIDPQLEFELRKDELAWKKEIEAKKIEAELKKAESQGALLETMASMFIPFIGQQFSKGKSNPAPPGGQTVDTVPVQCDCGNQMLVPKGTQSVECSVCHQVSAVEWGTGA